MRKIRRPNDSNRMPNAGEFEASYREHYGAISRFVARRVAPPSHDEVVAATFVVAWRKFAAADSPSLAWLYRIASFEVAHERRRLGRQTQDADLNDVQLIETTPMDAVFDLSKAFSQLSASDAELLRLVYWESLSHREVADVLGLSVNAVNVRCHRALERLSGAVSHLSGLSDESKSTRAPTKEF